MLRHARGFCSRNTLPLVLIGGGIAIACLAWFPPVSIAVLVALMVGTGLEMMR